MRAVFAGTPAFAVPALIKIIDMGYEILVVTQPDKPQGRHKLLTPSPVKAEALSRGIAVFQPARIREDFAPIAAFGAEIMVTCAYGQILTQEILDLFPKGVWNIHASLLPAYRGAAPINRAIIDGARTTGVTIMKTDVGLDTGDILLARSLEISEDDTAGSLSEKLSVLGAECIALALPLIENGKTVLKKQGEGTATKKVVRTEADFSRPAAEVARLIRGLSPAPCAFAAAKGQTYNFYRANAVEFAGDLPAGTVVFADGKRGLVVKCGEGAVRLCELQPAGGKRMTDTAFASGRKLSAGDRFDLPRTL